MKKIEGSPKNLKQLLQNTKYSIHYYQREYMWQRKHIEELIDDLTSEFLDNYKPGDSRPAVAEYKLSKYCSNEGNIYTESLGQLAYQNNPKFKKFIADNGLTFKAYEQFGKTEIAERVELLVQLVRLVWNDGMFQ